MINTQWPSHRQDLAEAKWFAAAARCCEEEDPWKGVLMERARSLVYPHALAGAYGPLVPFWDGEEWEKETLPHLWEEAGDRAVAVPGCETPALARI